jgi:hypothetical protein
LILPEVESEAKQTDQKKQAMTQKQQVSTKFDVKLPDISEAELSKSLQKENTKMVTSNKFSNYNVSHSRTIRIGEEMITTEQLNN